MEFPLKREALLRSSSAGSRSDQNIAGKICISLLGEATVDNTDERNISLHFAIIIQAQFHHPLPEWNQIIHCNHQQCPNPSTEDPSTGLSRLRTRSPLASPPAHNATSQTSSTAPASSPSSPSSSSSAALSSPWARPSSSAPNHPPPPPSKWRHHTLPEAASFVAKNGTIIVCAVSHPWLPFLNNWLISLSRQKQEDKVLVVAEDYATLFEVNERWPGHAVLVPPAPDSQTAHDFGSLGFFNFTSRRPRHLLQILELGYNVMYNDVDMIKPLDHSHDLPPPEKIGRPYVDVYLLPQAAFPTGGLYFENKTWVEETKGKHVIIHNNWIVGFERKIKRFRDYGLWLVDDHANESPLGKL
ncbi:hypothetical protein Tsubulata_026824 [Turnera subulata]|uniref:Nucleotide-diphospho-sugar transferase domain-containing protein n=1 Tax=Turnera subulata TaxID=218843 RepID=A0A9Q0F698_9ROSI|nr:hypothetical protein Tsubulata_026824 [Turnera subulata]